VLDAYSNVKYLYSNSSIRNDSANKKAGEGERKRIPVPTTTILARNSTHHREAIRTGKTGCPIDCNPGFPSFRWVRCCKANSIRYLRFGGIPSVIKHQAVRPPRHFVDRVSRVRYTNMSDLISGGSHTKLRIPDAWCIVSGLSIYSYANAEHPRHKASVTANAAVAADGAVTVDATVIANAMRPQS